MNIFKKYGLVEQSLISLLNFLIVFMFGKNLPTSDFANFIIIHSALTFVFLIASGIWASPVLVFLPTKYSQHKNAYFEILFILNLITSIIFAIIAVVFVNIFIVRLELVTSIFSILTVVSWGQYELLRKNFYADNKLKSLMNSSIILVVFFFLGNLLFKNSLTIDLSFAVLFLSYFIAIVYIIIRTQPFTETIKNLILFDFKQIVRVHWDFSKWTILSSLYYWISTSGYFILLSFFLEDLQLGAMRSILNILGLVSVFLVFFENMYTPKASNIYYNSNGVKLNNYINGLKRKFLIPYIGIVFMAIIMSYLLFGVFFNDAYMEYKYLIIIFGLYQLALGLNRPPILGIRVINKTRYISLGNLIAAVLTILLGLTLMSIFRNVFVASISMFISVLISSFYLIIVYKRLILIDIKERGELGK